MSGTVLHIILHMCRHIYKFLSQRVYSFAFKKYISFLNRQYMHMVHYFKRTKMCEQLSLFTFLPSATKFLSLLRSHHCA